MIPLDEAIGRLAWTQIWQVTLVAVGLGLAARCCRRRPHLAYLLWLVVLVKCVTPPLWSSPTSLFSWTATVDATRASIQRLEADAAGVSSAARTESPVAREATRQAESNAVAAPLATSNLTPAADATVAASKTGWSLTLVLGLLWLIGAAVHGGIVLWTVVHWGRTMRERQIPVEPPLAALTEQLARRLGIKRTVRLVVTSQPVGPVTYGWLRPAIVFPQALVDARSLAELEPLLAHELIHVRRGDALVGLVQVVVQSLWWFHPLVQWANRRMIFERERCCDEEVLAALDFPPSRYAAGLLSVLELKQKLRTPAALPGVRRLEITRQRLEHLLHGGHFQNKTPRRYWLVLAAAVLLLVPGAGLSGSGEPGVTKPRADGAEPKAKAEPIVPSENREETASQAADQRAVPPPKLGIHLTDIRQTAGKDPGSVVWRFTVAEPVGTQFQIDYLQIGVRGASGAGFGIFTTTADRAEVELTLEYRPEFSGDRNVDVLHSRVQLLTLKVNITGVNLPGMTTVASPPLLTVAPDEREIALIEQDDDARAVTRFGGRRILLANPKSQAGQNSETMNVRAEIDVTRYEKQPTPTLSATERLTNLWARQQHEIGSAHIEYRLVRGGDTMLAPLDRDKVNKILAAADLDKHPENFASAAAKLMLPEVMQGRAEVVGMKGDFFSAGLNRRDQHAQDVRLYDGDLDLSYNGPNHQIDVYAGGAKSNVAYTTINDFRIRFGISTSRYDTAALRSYEHEAQADGKIHLWKKVGDHRADWIADPDTGFIERASSDGPNETGDRFQYAPVRYPGGIVMPTLKISTRFRDGVLDSLEIWKVDKAQFNDGMPAGIFHLAAKAGTNVFIYWSDPAAEPKCVQLKAETADIAEFLRGRSDLVDELRMDLPNRMR